jgi:putative ABC transport system permease protein
MNRPGKAPVTYRVLLRLLPRLFRERHGAAMEETFASARAEAARAGRMAVTRLYAREAADVLLTGIRLRVRSSARARHAVVLGATGRRRSPGAALLDDIVLGMRSLSRNAAFFAFAALTLGFGVGATTAMYSALKEVVLEPPAYAGGERAVRVWRTMGSGLRVPPNADQIELVRAETTLFEAVATYSSGKVTVTGLGEPVQLAVQRGTADLASFMGVRPVVGRMFTDEELAGEGAHVVLLSHALWRARFGGRTDVTGEPLHVNGEPWTIIGVLPPDIVRPDALPEPIDLWLPLGEAQQGSSLMARLAPEVTIEQAGDRLTSLRGEDAESELEVVPATSMREGGLREPLRVLMIAVALLLLIACVNVANLLLHRNAARGRDTVVRAALGATRSRLVRQALAESLLLALCGCAMGVAVAWAGTVAAAALRPADLAAIQAIDIDRGVLVFSLLISLGAWLLFSLMPALRGARRNAAEALSSAARTGAGGSARLRWTLVGFEVALSFALLVGAATLIVNVRDSARRDTGYQPASFVAMDVTLPVWRYQNEADRRAAFERLVTTVRRMPGVDDVALAAGVPPHMGIAFGIVHPEGRAPDEEATVFHGGGIDDAYLRTIGQPLIAGRTFLPHEVRDGADVVVLGETAARRFFGGGDAVGRRFSLMGDQFTVVGVVRDIAIVGLANGESDRPIAYWPLPEVWEEMQILVRTERRDADFIATLTSLVRTMDTDVLVTVTAGSKLLGATLARARFTAALLTAFAAIALLLSAIGLYGVLSQIVTSRTHEIGLRVALGADRASIRSLILNTGGRVVLAGLLAGALLVTGGLRVLSSSIFGIEHRGFGVYGAAALALGVTSLLAMWRPAMRAARIDPVRAMSAD